MAVYLIIMCVVLFYIILYFAIKAAVRDGIIEAQNIKDRPSDDPSEGTGISKVACPNLGENMI